MNLIFSILGVLGGLLTSMGDILLDLKGKGNQKLGTSKNIDSNWLNMSEWRFRVSVLCGLIGCPMGGLGLVSLANQIEPSWSGMAFVLKLSAFIGTMGAFFIHSFLSIQPIIYKRIMKTNQFELADEVLEGLYKAIRIPFFTLYVVIGIIPTVCVIIAVLNGCLQVPVWMIFMNPIVTSIIGWILRAVNKDIFYDMPAIIMSSVGTSLLNVIGIVNILG